jgi:fatty acid desaturase
MNPTSELQLRQHAESAAVHSSDERAGSQPGAFNAREASAIVRDLLHPDPRIYWLDMLVSVAVAYPCAWYYFSQPFDAPGKYVALLISGLALFRLGTFMHEIQHFSGAAMRRFTFCWNVLCGIPMLTPSFLYDNHISHHRSTTYGTIDDGEYLPLGRGAWGHFAVYIAQALLLPVIVAFRFLVLTPLALANRAWRRLVLERFSFYGINPHYRHKPHDPMPRSWAWLEAACMLRAWAVPIGIAYGLLPTVRIAELYLLASVSLGLNYVRNIAAHRYRNEGERMTYTEQLLDSINITGHPLWTELLFPVGLRYHALHHMVPSLPYHNLGRAHRRLMAELPADSPYRRTVYPSFGAVVRQLWSDAREARIGTQEKLQRTAA